MSDDPCEWPPMMGSHGMKDAVGPYRLSDPEQLKLLFLAAIPNLEPPWRGDRLAKETMRAVLTCFWFALSELGYYDEPEEPKRKTRVVPPT